MIIYYKMAAMERYKTVNMARPSFYTDDGGSMYHNSY
jgi:hypothetical protein